MKKSNIKEDSLDHKLMMNELSVMQSTFHPNITRIFELMEDHVHYFIIMEFVGGGDLMSRLEKEDHFTEVKAAKIMNQLFLAVNCMHQKKIVHRDLKPDNLLCEVTKDKSISVKLADMGFAAYYEDNSDTLK
jgi:calcium-dependent protein kinase